MLICQRMTVITFRKKLKDNFVIVRILQFVVAVVVSSVVTVVVSSVVLLLFHLLLLLLLLLPVCCGKDRLKNVR